MSDQRGFSIIESLVCCGILGILAAATSSLVRTSYVTATRNANQTHAMSLATQELEDIRSSDYSLIVSRTPTNSPNTWNGISYAIASTVAADTPILNTKTVTSTVTWSERGTSRSYSLQTIYAATH